MKKLLFLLFCLFNTCASFCQAVYPYQDFKLEAPADYKETEPFALSAATFLLSTPFKENDINRSRALQFLSSWMAGTKDYNFQLQGIAQGISDDPNLFSIYMAATAKFCLENKNVSTNTRLVEVSSCKLVLAYCDNPVNNFKLKKKMRKWLENN